MTLENIRSHRQPAPKHNPPQAHEAVTDTLTATNPTN